MSLESRPETGRPRGTRAGTRAKVRPPVASATNSALPALDAAAAVAAAAPMAPVEGPPAPARLRHPPRVVRPTAEQLTIDELRVQLLESIRQHHTQGNLEAVERAFDLAVAAHEGEKRASGEPFVTHPIASAQILADLGLDPVAIQAALLHDVPEDTEFSLNDVELRFGHEVARLVDGVTKLSKFGPYSVEQQQAENIRKMLLAMAEDVRVVLIKLADRLHNMRTLDALPSDKQTRIARQTMEIYAPLAERLGIWQIKWELEDLAFKALEPLQFRELARNLELRRKNRQSFIERAITDLRPELAKAGIEADLSGRPKHIYSIYKKMQRNGT